MEAVNNSRRMLDRSVFCLARSIFSKRVFSQSGICFLGGFYVVSHVPLEYAPLPENFGGALLSEPAGSYLDVSKLGFVPGDRRCSFLTFSDLSRKRLSPEK